MRRVGLLLALGAALLGALPGRAAATPPPVAAATASMAARVQATYAHLPLRFEVNAGQTHGQVRFVAHSGGASLFLTAREAVLVLRPAVSSTGNGHVQPAGSATAPGAVLRLRFVGGNATPPLTGRDRLPGVSNYFLGNNPRRWQTNVPAFAQVVARGVYPDVDVVYHGSPAGGLEYDVVLRPGAHLAAVRQALVGAHSMRLAADGSLVLAVAGGAVKQAPVVAYQAMGGRRVGVAARYVLGRDGTVGFAVGRYDRSQPLVLDPLLGYSTYLGGNLNAFSYGIAVDTADDAYITGYTDSTDFPTANALQPTFAGGEDIFVSKFNAAGSALIYSTYLGGVGVDEGYGIAVDAAGNAFLTGTTSSTNFPIVNALQPTLAGHYDAFVSKLNAAGSALIYSTYLGGSGKDTGTGITVDGADDVYLTGYTTSTDFPTANALQTTNHGGSDAFVSKLNPTGSALIYSTYLGGSGQDEGTSIAADTTGDAYFTGTTYSTDFPTANALQPTNHGGSDAFVSKLSAAGSALIYSTYLGGSSADDGLGIAVDGAGNAYLTGSTTSTDFPTANAVQPANHGTSDAFVSKLNAAGSALVYSTYLGGSKADEGNGITVDGAGNAYLTGFTYSSDFPTTNAPQSTYHGGKGDAFVSKFNAAGSALVYSTYLGGSFQDYGLGIIVDTAGNAYVTGYTASTNFPTADALQPDLANDAFRNAFVAQIVASGATLTATPASASITSTLTLTGTGFAPDEPVAVYWDNADSPPLTTTTANATGTITALVQMPLTPYGGHQVLAVGQSSGTAAGAIVQVTPVVVLQTHAAPPGARDTTSGAGFADGETVMAYLYSTAGQQLWTLGSATTDALGSFSGSTAITFTVPNEAPGAYTVSVIGLSSSAHASRPIIIQ